MKKLLLLASLCIISFAGYSQARKLTVINNSPCNVYYVLYGDVPPNCVRNYRSVVVMLPAGGVDVYNDPTAISMSNGSGGYLGTSDVFTSIRVYKVDPASACSITGHTEVGGCGAIPSIAPVTQYDNSTCLICGSNTVKWTMLNPTDGQAEIY